MYNYKIKVKCFRYLSLKPKSLHQKQHQSVNLKIKYHNLVELVQSRLIKANHMFHLKKNTTNVTISSIFL